jgi:urease accessory protein
MKMKLKQLVMALCVLPVSGAVMAHTGHPDVTGFASGFTHPFTGFDHLVAMLRRFR